MGILGTSKISISVILLFIVISIVIIVKLFIYYVISKYIKIGQDKYIKDLIDIPKMYEECKKMILGVKESLENEDENLAREIALNDDKVDSLYDRVQEDCLKVMSSNPQTINQGVNLLFIGRYFERIGDHTTNICEKIIFAINGEMVEIG